MFSFVLLINPFLPHEMIPSLFLIFHLHDTVTSGAATFSDTTYTTTKNKFLTNPHLIKLVDATPDMSYNAQGTTSGTLLDKLATAQDNAFRKYTQVKLCNLDFFSNYATGFSSDTATCTQKEPPGFYAVVYYDTASSVFRLVTQAKHDYASTTYFHVFTTRGIVLPLPAFIRKSYI